MGDLIQYDFGGQRLDKPALELVVNAAIEGTVTLTKAKIHRCINRIVPLESGKLRQTLHGQIDSVVYHEGGITTFYLTGPPYTLYVDKMPSCSLQKSGTAPQAEQFFIEKLKREIKFYMKYYERELTNVARGRVSRQN